ncbi:putative response regulator receiver [Pseudoalteromonas luteoviolacea B = ATCC 29581]|nr:putative response regulator receiver [Pseudoalteromonas luteoviolacea B = ATCC 29581]
MSDFESLFGGEDVVVTSSVSAPWKILIVDDEPDIHALTKLALSNFKFKDKPLMFLDAHSGLDARSVLQEHDDIAVILLDVVMESDTAGLDVAKFCREELGNQMSRIILRTGQPGSAPEKKVMQKYDINDYKNKTELTSDRLFATVLGALRSYKELHQHTCLHVGLSKVVKCNSALLRTSTSHECLQALHAELPNTLPLIELNHHRADVNFAIIEQKEHSLNLLSKNGDWDWLSAYKRLVTDLIIQEPMTNIVKEELASVFLHCNHSGACLYLLLQYPEIICEEESILLTTFSQNLVVSCNNIWLNEALSSINDDLENKVEERTKALTIANQKAEQASVAKSQFLANMSHEIRTPMNAILGFAQVLMRSPTIPKEHLATLSKIGKAGEHLLDIINDVLEISKIEAGAMTLKPVNFDLICLLNEIGAMLSYKCEQKGLTFVFDNQVGENKPVYADQSKLRQIFINLLGNAVKFTDDGEVKLSVYQTDKGLRFDVIDTGPGIAPSEQEKLFTNFKQGKAGQDKGGTGLGLAIAAKQIAMMGGNLAIESKLGHGSRFYFSLTLTPATDPVVPTNHVCFDAVKLKQGKSFRALIVDDNLENREVLSSVLKDCNIAFDEAENGQAALVRMKSQYYDIAFIDLLMPVMRGDELIVALRKDPNFTATKCVAISAFSLSHEIQYYLSIGFNRFIPKPYRFTEIYECLTHYFPTHFDVYIHELDEKVALPDTDVIINLSMTDVNALRQAAEMNRLSKAKEIIQAAIANDPETRECGEYLTSFIENYDMEGLIKALNGVRNV